MPGLLNTLEKKLFPFVKKPFRYTGGELNSVKKDPSNLSLSGVLCFPEIYDIGMSHFGSSILYNIINKRDRWYLKRSYHPCSDAEEIMREEGIPLYALEDLKPVSENHWIGFSVQYELQYTNILNMLDLAGIPLLSAQRDQNHPLVIAGGPCVVNPEPIADFIDIFALGDGEEILPEILEIMESSLLANDDRTKTLNSLNHITSVYIPELTKDKKRGVFRIPEPENRIETAKVFKLREGNYTDKPVVPLVDVVHHRLASEVMRGCSRGCRFCSAGFIYRPVRERGASDIMEGVQRACKNTGWSDVTLLSLSTSDHSGIASLIKGINSDKGRNYSLPSTRADSLSEERLDTLLEKSGTSSFTIAPEAGTERLRRIINKDFTDETVVETSYRLFCKGVKTIKLYFMIGLPMETMEDIQGIWELVERINRKTSRVKGRRYINVSLSPFTPKPHTPFQREPFLGATKLKERSMLVLENLKKYKNIKISYRNPDMSRLETILSRGDRSISGLIYRAWRDGALFDGWDDFLDISIWNRAAKKESVDLSLYTDRIDTETHLPWEFINTGITEEYLKNEYDKAINGEMTPDCRRGECTNCGVCKGELKPVYADQKELNYSIHEKKTRSKSEHSKDSTGPQILRFTYCKKGRMRFLSHLNTIEVFKRAFAASGVPVCYSQGYKKKPKFSFAPPLPYGVMGENELFDIQVEKPDLIDITHVNNFLPQGMEIKGYNRENQEKSRLSKEIKRALYRFETSFVTDYRERIEWFMGQSRVEVSSNKKGKTVVRDIRELVLELKPDDRGVQALLYLEPGKTCRPSDLIKTLFPENDFFEFDPVRLRIMGL